MKNWFLIAGLVVWLAVPWLFENARQFLPIAELAIIFGVIEIAWNVTFVATLVAFGLGDWLRTTVIKAISVFGRIFPTRPKRLLAIAIYMTAVVVMPIWPVFLSPIFLVVLSLWDSVKSPAVLADKVGKVREVASRNTWGRRWFYLNRIVAFAQPNAVLAFLIWYRFRFPDWSVQAWLGNLAVLAYALSDNWSTWAFFRAFQILISPEKTYLKEGTKVGCKIVRASQYATLGLNSIDLLAAALRELDTAIWSEHQRAVPGSIERRVATSPDTIFVLVRQEGDRHLVAGALFARLINFREHFPVGRSVFRVSWQALENGGDFTPEAGARDLWTVSIMVRPGEARGSGGMLEAALGGYAASQGYRFVAGGSRLTGAAEAYAKSGDGVGRDAFLREYITLTGAKGWPVDATLCKLVKGGSVLIGGRKVAQLLQVVGVALDYFDDPESLDAAALIVYENPLWWIAPVFRPLWGKVLQALVSI